jgi:hypothetical protein
VRDGEALMVELDVVVEQDVQIDVTWSLVDNLLASQGVFDVLERIQQLKWF